MSDCRENQSRFVPKGLLGVNEGLPVNRHAISQSVNREETFKPKINKISKYMKRDITDLLQWNEQIQMKKKLL